jgi:origin recognition complex subunit 2
MVPAMFKKWNLQLKNGFSLLVYGVGSKYDILLRFVTSNCLGDIPTLVVDGFKPKVDIKKVFECLSFVYLMLFSKMLSHICREVLFLKKIPSIKESSGIGKFSSRSVERLVRAVLKYCNYNRRLCILVNGVDSLALQSVETQRVFSLLAEHRFIYFIASADNIHAQLCMFDYVLLSANL